MELCINIFEDDFYYYYSGVSGIIRIKKKFVDFKNPRNFVEVLKFLPKGIPLKNSPKTGVSDYWIYDYFFDIKSDDDFALNIQDFGLIMPEIPKDYLKYETNGIIVDKTFDSSLIISYPSNKSYHAFEIMVEYLGSAKFSLDLDFGDNSKDRIDFCKIFFIRNEVKVNLSRKDYESILFIKITLQKLDEIFF